MNVTTTLRQENIEEARPTWRIMGWQGISMQAPQAWNLVAYSGDAKAGSLRLDNGEPTSKSAVGVELRWSTPKGKLTVADIEKRLDQYFSNITKDAKRHKLIAATKSKEIIDEARPERDAVRSFSWRTDRRGFGRIWHCSECGRVVIAQVTGGASGDWPSMATDMLRSMECHATEIGWQTWSLYDLLTQVPTDYALFGKPQLMNIYVQLTFRLGQSLDTLSVEQWGVANVQLRGNYLDQWFRQKNAAQEPTLTYEASEATAHGHPALALSGRRAGLTYWASQAMPQAAKLQMPATHFAAVLWECPDSNKVHLVQCYSRKPQGDLVREVVERTPCHF